MAQLLNRASSAVVRSGARGEERPQGLGGGGPVLQRQRCLHRRGGRLDVGAAAVQLADKLDDALGEGRLQPDQFGVAAPQPGRVYSDDVLQAAHRKVEPLPLCAAGPALCGGSARCTSASSCSDSSIRSMAATVEPAIASSAPWPMRCGRCPCWCTGAGSPGPAFAGRFRRSRARCTLTRALARAARAAKSGTPGDIRSGRAANRARSDSSLRASSSLLSARMRDISPTLPPAGVSCPAAGGNAVDHQHEHQQESRRKPVECRGGDPLRRRLAARRPWP